MRLKEWEGQDAEGEWQIQGLLQVMQALEWGLWQPKITALQEVPIDQMFGQPQEHTGGVAHEFSQPFLAPWPGAVDTPWVCVFVSCIWPQYTAGIAHPLFLASLPWKFAVSDMILDLEKQSMNNH